MKHIFAIYRRDIWSLLIVPTGAIVAGLFALACGIVFVAQVLHPSSIATMQPVFNFAAWLLLLLCPAITMRLIAEERRVGTWELLLASPATSFEIVKGKFLAAWTFLLLVLLSTLPLVFVLELYASVDYGAVASGYLGLFLLGGAVLATGLFVSATTTSQTVAYLVTTFFWITLSLSTKVLPGYVPTRFADVVFALDPDLRMGAFSIGLIDTANIVYFLSIQISVGWITIIAVDRTRRCKVSIWKVCVSGLLVLIAIVSVNNVAMQPVARIRIDATGTRAYTLSEQTRLLLDSLENPWKIVVLLDDATVAKPVIQQVDEVLRRYSEGSSHIEVERINPANPASISQYEALLQTLLHLYEGELSTAERAIDSAVASFQELMVFASSTSAWAEQVAELTSKSKEKETLQTVASSLALLGSDGGLILNEVTKAMQVDAGHPLPQINSARDILVAATGQWSQELAEVAWWLSDGKSMSISSICASQVSAFEKMAVQLAKCDDELRQLGNLELGQLAMQLASGEGAIIISEDSATMIPASLIFPRSGIMQETTAIDQRFRGEQIISSAMRSLKSTVQPTVVFVHAEEGSLLGRRQNNVDLWSVRGLLETSRFGVAQWIPADDPRPSLPDGPVVWVVIPPSSRAGLTPSPREQSLLDATFDLLSEDKPVLLNLQPSLLPRYGQKDPWSTLVKGIGITIDTEHVLVEQIATGQNRIEVQRSQMIDDMHSNHLIARAVSGRQIFLPFPLRVTGGEPLIVIEPSEDLWFDANWERAMVDSAGKNSLDKQVQIAAAIEHTNGSRAVIIGSGGWLFSWAADRAVSLGGNQIAMVNPGNSELLLASVEWLSGLDDWIAASPLGQQTSRVDGLSQTVYFVWTIILILGIPFILVLASALTLFRRSRR
jgi:ABC-2 type transport system permease protein